MNWIQWRLHIKGTILESLEDWLLGSGAMSLTYQDAADKPILEPDPGEVRLWDDLLLIALYEGDINTQANTDALLSSPFSVGILDQRWEALEDKDWIRAWMEDYKPMKFGNSLWITPTNMEPPEPTANNIILDPGLAFGTGTHPTTALCLTYLDKTINGGERVIDFGCGSGILALAAIKLGAQEAIGVDHDSQAIIASRANAELNEISEQQFMVYTSESFQPQIADGVVANILAATLKELVDEIVTLVKPGGWIALSGILESQVLGVQTIYAPWIDFNDPVYQGEWALLTGIRKS